MWVLEWAGVPGRRITAGSWYGIAALALCVSACLSTDQLVHPDALTLDFSLGASGVEPGHAPEVQGSEGTIIVRGMIVTANCGWTWEPELTRRPDGYRLTVVGDHVGGATIACFYGYRATVSGLPPRVYVIEVVHGHGGPVAVDNVRVN